MYTQARAIREVNLEELFKTNYIVPVYQRRYSWDKKDWQILLRDIKNSGSKEKIHFMSSILIKPIHGEFNSYEIVDGQQRITTINLLFKVVIDAFMEEIHDATFREALEKDRVMNSRLSTLLSDSLIYSSSSSTQGSVKTPKLSIETIVEKNIKFFHNNPLDFILSEKIEELSPSLKNELKQTLTYKCFEFFKKEIEAEIKTASTKEKILLFNSYAKAIHSLRFILIPLHAEEAPQIIFESINELGKKLTIGEIIKNALLMRLKDKDSAERIYKLYLKELDSEYFTSSPSAKNKANYIVYQWFRAMGTSMGLSNADLKEIKLLDSDSLSTGFRKLLMNQTQEFSDNILTDLEKDKKVTNISKKIGLTFRLNLYLNGELTEKTDIETLGDIAYLNRIQRSYDRLILGTKATQNWALIYRLSSLKTNAKISYNDWSQTLDIIESYVVRNLFLKENNYGGETVLRIINLVNKAESNSVMSNNLVSRELNKLIKNELNIGQKRWISNEEIFSRIDSSLPHSLEHAKTVYEKMFLAELHNYKQENKKLQNKKLILNARDYSHEHWMPVSSNSGWNIKGSNKNDYCWSIGNHALLPQTFNSLLGNKSLQEKLQMVSDVMNDTNSTGIESLDEIILPLLERKKKGLKIEWTESDIKNRERTIVKAVFNNIFKDLDDLHMSE